MDHLYRLVIRFVLAVVLMLGMPHVSIAQNFQVPEEVDLGPIPAGLVVFQPIAAENKTDRKIALSNNGGFSFTSDAYLQLLPDSGCPGKTFLAPFESREIMAVASTNESGPAEAYAVVSDDPESDPEGSNGVSIKMLAEGIIIGDGPYAQIPEYALFPDQTTGRIFINEGEQPLPTHLRYTNVLNEVVRIERAALWNGKFARIVSISSKEPIELPYALSPGETVDFEIEYTKEPGGSDIDWDQLIVETSATKRDLSRFDISPQGASSTSKVADQSLAKNFQVFPNPASESINVLGATDGFVITDMLGRIQLQAATTSSSVAFLPNGRYLIADHAGTCIPLVVEH
jgi:hypothetical protein